MVYKLRFHELAFAEWRALNAPVREQLKKKLIERLKAPRIPSAALSGMSDCYKIKLRKAGYRLVYRVDDDTIYVTIISIGKRDKSEAYTMAKNRL